MPKTRFSDDLQFVEFVTSELASRVKDTQNAISLKGTHDSLHARMIILVAYSNFEGFLQNVCGGFLEHIASKRLGNSTLKPELLALFLWAHREQHQTVPSDAVIDHLVAKYDPNFRVRPPKEVDLESNVTSTVLNRLARCLCFSTAADYRKHATFIDEHVLKVRNAAAHGQEIEIGLQLARERAVTLGSLMRQFSTDLQNVVVMKSYCR